MPVTSSAPPSAIKPAPRTRPAFPQTLDMAVGQARDMADRYEKNWNDPYLDDISQKLPGFEAAFKKNLSSMPLPASMDEFHRALIQACVGGIAIGVATEALTKADKPRP